MNQDERFRLAKKRLDGISGCSCLGTLIIAAIMLSALILASI